MPRSKDILNELKANELRVFAIDDAEQTLQFSRQSLYPLLQRLVSSGSLERLRRGLYALTYPATTSTPVHEFEIGAALTRPSAIGFWSALNYHSLSDQTPRTVSILASDRSKPRLKGQITVRSVPFRIVRVKNADFFGLRQHWIGEAAIPFTDPERTLLDGLLRPQLCGDFGEVMHAFEQHLPNLNAERMIDYALRLGSPAIQRCGWAFEELGLSAKALEEAVPRKGYRKLDVQGPEQGNIDEKWMLRINL